MSPKTRYASETEADFNAYCANQPIMMSDFMTNHRLEQPVSQPIITPYKLSSSLLTMLLLSTYTYATEAGLANAIMTSLPFTPMLANQFDQKIDLGHYWKSEKLDGIRAIWTGTHLITRSGKPINAPPWFIAPLPNYPLEGELWAGRGHFALIQQTVLDQQPNDQAWQRIKLMLFDAPQQLGHYPIRYQILQRLVANQSSRHINVIEHTPIRDLAELKTWLNVITKQGGEGIMLRNTTSHYQGGRHRDLLKLKLYQDAEAELIGFLNGKGKYKGMVGAMLVKTIDGVVFAIGSGLSDELRRNPPSIGTIINYRYNGLTHLGKPRFARFLRVKVQ
jgi:DNA ligase-1